MNAIAYANRQESNMSVDRGKMYKKILNILNLYTECTAREVAWYMGSIERNTAAPRLNELCAEGKVKIVGKKKCELTNRRVSVYAINRIN